MAKSPKAKCLFSSALFLLCTMLVPAANARPCVWPRCNKQAVRQAPQLCAEHLRLPPKREGAQLVKLIWANDVEGIRRLAPIAGPDYFVDGSPPLVHALYSGNIDSAQALIDAGADHPTLVRSGPGMNYPEMGQLNNGDEVTITGSVVMNNETDWYPIRTTQTKGWVRGKFLRRK